MLRAYNGAGYRVKFIHCDLQFQPLMDAVKDGLEVTMNYTSQGDHQSEAERNNRVIQERFRAIAHSLPYKVMPPIMIRYLAMVCTHALNFFPAKNGISAHYSPYMLMYNKTLDYKKQCQVPFGSYVQVPTNNDITNTPESRTIDAIYLRPTNTMQEGHEVMDLNSGRKITRSRIVATLPIPPHVTAAVEQLGYDQGIKEYKFKNRRKVIFHPTDWIAGVEYTHNDDENNTEEDSDDEEYVEEDDEEDEDEIPPDDDDDEIEEIDQEEVDELLSDSSTNPTNGTLDDDSDETATTAEATNDDDTASTATATRRSARTAHQPTRLNVATTSGQSYLQKKKKSN